MLPEDKFYKVRYGILPSNDIFNFVGPANGSFNLPEKDAQARIARRLKIGKDFYLKLEESIKQEGFRNPILVYAGWMNTGRFYRCPTHIKDQGMEKLLMCVSCGGSRLYIANQLGIDIPCIIIDHIDRFSQFEELTTEDEILAKFKDAPNSIVCGRREIEIRLSQ